MESEMMHHLEATDPDYDLDRITDGPYVPLKLVSTLTIDGKVIDEHMKDNPKAEWTKEDKENGMKDAKVRNILFNSLDAILTNYVLSCKIGIHIWNRLQVHCEGTELVKKNMKSMLVQEYEYFEAKSGETLTETYNKFTRLLNDMAMHNKYYDNEDVNRNSRELFLYHMMKNPQQLENLNILMKLL